MNALRNTFPTWVNVVVKCRDACEATGLVAQHHGCTEEVVETQVSGKGDWSLEVKRENDQVVAVVKCHRPAPRSQYRSWRDVAVAEPPRHMRGAPSRRKPSRMR